MFSAALRSVAAATALLLALPADCIAQSDARVARPEVKAGDRWIYRRTDNRTNKSAGTREERVTFASDATIQTVVTIFGNDQETDATYTSSWNSVSSFDGGVIAPDTGTLRFPLKVGDTYQANYENRRPRRGAFHVTHQRTAKAVAWEEVVVPAGKFRALKVEVEGSYKRLDSGLTGRTRVVLWYVPEIRRWAKFGFEETAHRGPDSWYVDELIDYKVN
jgi:hypothetical protein